MILFDNDLKPSKACIKFFVSDAIKRKRDAEQISPEFYNKCSMESQRMFDEYKTESIHVLARSAMHYTRYRAKLGGLDKYPWDRPARKLWFELNDMKDAGL